MSGHDALGQFITFSTVVDPDYQYRNYVWIRVKSKDETIRKIAASRNHPEMAHEIAKLNHIRSVRQKLKKGRLIKLPGTADPKLSFDVHAQDQKPPKIVDGYANFQIAQRYGQKGISQFMGYNPLAMDVFIAFEGYGNHDAGPDIEVKIQKLERMAGRGPYVGAAHGPPAIIEVLTLDNNGNTIGLVPQEWQYPVSGIQWRIVGIDWDDGDLRDNSGNRWRSTATVHLWEYVPITLAPTLTQRAKKKGN